MGIVKTTFIGDTKPQDRAVSKLQADLAKYKSQRERDEQALTRLVERQAEQRARAEIRSLQSVQREIQRIRREEDRLAQQRSQTIAGYRQTGAQGFVAGAIGAGFLAQQAIDKAIEQSRANRLIASAATEAGVAQDKLAAANKRFAESVGLSNVAAASTTAQIQRLATYAGRPQDVDRLLQSFANLGAARGIGGRDLEGLIGTILSGQDEGLNRLGISDPGQLQKAYAASIGKTVQELTQQEKVQAAVNAVMEKAAIFTGAAEDRMNSLEGQVARTAAQWENFTNALATTFTTSGPVTEFLNEASRALGGISIEVDKVNAALKQGKTPRQIAEEFYPGPTAGDYLTAAATGSYGLAGLLGRTGAFGDAYRRAVSPDAIAERRRTEFESQIAAQQRSNRQQELAAAQQRQNQSIATYTAMLERQRDAVFGPEAIKAQLAEAERRASLLLQKPNVSLGELQRGLKAIPGLGLSELDTLNLQQDYQRKIDEEKKRRADELKKKLDELRQAQISAFDSFTSGSANPFINFLGDANRRMQNLLETTKVLSPAIREALLADQRVKNYSAFTSLSLQNRLEALSYRTQAGEFRQGFRNDLSDPATVQRILDGQLNILAGRFDPAKDQALINLASGLDPRLLRTDQNYSIASAFEREASRKLENERTAADFYTSMQKLITEGGLKVRVSEGATLQVDVTDSTSTGVTTGTQGNVRSRYERR